MADLQRQLAATAADPPPPDADVSAPPVEGDVSRRAVAVAARYRPVQFRVQIWRFALEVLGSFQVTAPAKRS